MRSICGEQVIVAEGKENIDFSKIISMNETSAFLWNNIQGKEFTHDDLVDLLTETYQVDAQKALEDVTRLVENWKSAGIIE